jgi:hypothetical protein
LQLSVFDVLRLDRVTLKNLIVRTKDSTEFGLNARNIFGLTVFGDNRVPIDPFDDPSFMFLRGLAEEHECSVHTGNLQDMADVPEEIFGNIMVANPLHEIRTSLYGGIFYDSWMMRSFPACFFPRIEESFWRASIEDNSLTFPQIINYGAIALYIGPKDDSSEIIKKHGQRGFDGPEEWLNLICDAYRLVVVAKHDGDYFRAYAQDKDAFENLTNSLENAA